MENCPSLQEWLDLADGRISPVRAAQLHAHLATGCQACMSQQAWMGRVLVALPAAGAPGLAQSTRLLLRELAATRLEARARPLWIATLFRDSRQQQAVGARGSDEGIQLRYEAGDLELRLWAEPAPAAPWYLIGQVYDRTKSDFLTPEAIALIASDGTTQTAETEGTEFHFATVTTGTYRLAVRLAESELLIPEVVLGQV